MWLRASARFDEENTLNKNSFINQPSASARRCGCEESPACEVWFQGELEGATSAASLHKTMPSTPPMIQLETFGGNSESLLHSAFINGGEETSNGVRRSHGRAWRDTQSGGF